METKIIRSKKKHKINHRDGGFVEINHYTRSKAVKLYCTQCLGWESHPKDCDIADCPLFPFRGKMLATMYAKNVREQ